MIIEKKGDIGLLELYYLTMAKMMKFQFAKICNWLKVKVYLFPL